jgi:23S rRNA (cytosine1962-C5)-methyltransferase
MNGKGTFVSYLPKVHLKRTKRLLAGHLWIFSNELYESPKNYPPGAVVELYDMREAFMGMGYINPKSLIAVRLLTREKIRIDKEFFGARISSALQLRERFFSGNNALRLVFSEGDYLPGLVVDRYGGCLVVQLLTAGMEAFKAMIVELLDDMINPEVIVLRNDSRSRSLEGLPREKKIVKGDLNAFPVISEGGLLFEVDPYEGQKTGFFLDQRENRRALAEFLNGGRGLDLFCYTGGWALRLAASGVEVTAVDSSESAITLGARNAGLNGLQEKAAFIKKDVFLFLRAELETRERRYDFIVCDPPAFVKSGETIKEGVRAYGGLNESCMKLLKPGGILATSSCSYHIDKGLFLDTLRVAARHAARRVRLLELRSQAKDHPVLLSMPETEYLKCAFLLVD